MTKNSEGRSISHRYREVPLLQNKHYAAPSVFTPENLLREARRQKTIALGEIPEICVLDPDGDMVRYLQTNTLATPDSSWSCYHTVLYRFALGGSEAGIVGCAVGGPFAVLVAEQMFVSGCRLLISVTSAGQIAPKGEPPYFVLIDKALRDEGTSLHYLPRSTYSYLNPALREFALTALGRRHPPVETATAWTTDAPFRETQQAISFARNAGILAVEMEAAALYAFSTAKQKPVICFAHITNQMGNVEGDFEKGEADGSVASLELIECIAERWRRQNTGMNRSAEQ